MAPPKITLRESEIKVWEHKDFSFPKCTNLTPSSLMVSVSSLNNASPVFDSGHDQGLLNFNPCGDNKIRMKIA